MACPLLARAAAREHEDIGLFVAHAERLEIVTERMLQDGEVSTFAPEVVAITWHAGAGTLRILRRRLPNSCNDEVAALWRESTQQTLAHALIPVTSVHARRT